MRKKSVLAFAGSVAFLAWRRSDDFGENRVADLCAAFGEAVDGFADFTPKPAFDAYGRAVASEDAGAGRVSVPVSETPVYFLGAWPTEIAKPSAPPVIGLAQKFRFFFAELSLAFPRDVVRYVQGPGGRSAVGASPSTRGR